MQAEPNDTNLYSVNVLQTEQARGTPLFRDGAIRNYAANVSGGTGLYRFFASGEWNDNQGIDYANERLQQGARTNLSVTPNEKFDLESSVGYIKSHTTLSCEAGCGGSLWGSLYSNPVNTSQFCTAASARGCGWGRGFNSSPPEAYRATQYWQDVNRFTGSITVKYNPTPWFTNRVAVGTDYALEGDVSIGRTSRTIRSRSSWGRASTGCATRTTTRRSTTRTSTRRRQTQRAADALVEDGRRHSVLHELQHLPLGRGRSLPGAWPRDDLGGRHQDSRELEQHAQQHARLLRPAGVRVARPAVS